MIKCIVILFIFGISLYNFLEGIVIFVMVSSNLELGFGIVLVVVLYNIFEGLVVVGLVYVVMGFKCIVILWVGIFGLVEIFGGVLVWLIFGSMIFLVVMVVIMVVVVGIMVVFLVDELMLFVKEIDFNNNFSYGVLCGMLVMGFSLVLL